MLTAKVARMKLARFISELAIVIALSLAIPSAGEAGISSEKERAIRKLMELTGVAYLGNQMSQQFLAEMRPIFPQVPESLWVEFVESWNVEELTELIIPIYDRHLSMTELQALIAFYSTPTGQSILQKLPTVTYESMVVGQQWGRAKGRELDRRLAERGYRPVER
jgi:hypothetical protein